MQHQTAVTAPHADPALPTWTAAPTDQCCCLYLYFDHQHSDVQSIVARPRIIMKVIIIVCDVVDNVSLLGLSVGGDHGHGEGRAQDGHQDGHAHVRD